MCVIDLGEGIFTVALDYNLLQSCATMTAKLHASCCNIQNSTHNQDIIYIHQHINNES